MGKSLKIFSRKSSDFITNDFRAVSKLAFRLKDSILRHITKAVVFRILAMISDFTIINYILKQPNESFIIVAVTNTIKTILYILHEKVWTKTHIGLEKRKSGRQLILHENIRRQILKSMSYRILILLSEALVFFVMDKRIFDSISIILFTNTASLILYFCYERIWNYIHWEKAEKHAKGA